MAVLIASSLRKELSGDPLFDGVSFKVERRDRVALAGPNGAGKTTLLEAIVNGRLGRFGHGVEGHRLGHHVDGMPDVGPEDRRRRG